MLGKHLKWWSLDGSFAAMRVELVVDERGREVASKTAETPEEAARLRREADLLEVAAHPGLVELLSFEEVPEARLTTARVGEGQSLAASELTHADEVAGVVAPLATTVADLHALGIVHGALAPEHVLLDEDGRPVLCSLGYGGLAGERPATGPDVPPAFVDPAAPEDAGLDASADVHAIGALLAHLLNHVEGQARRGATDALLRLARAATAPERASRPSARELADEIHAAVPGARLPSGSNDRPSVPRPDPLEARRRQRPLEGWRRSQLDGPSLRRDHRHRRLGRRPLLLAGILVVVAGVGAAVVGRTSQPSEPEATRVQPSTASPALADSRPPPSPPSADHRASARPAVPAGCPLLNVALTADVDGDGCAEPLRYADGVIEAGTLRWSVGQAGDVAVTGDWSCAGNHSLALLRPTTGEVFAFNEWATTDRDVHARLVAQVPGGRSLRPADLDGDGCHELVVEGTAATPSVLRPGEAP